MSLSDVYRKAWGQRFALGRGWSANWWPGTPISLGERGIMREAQFQHQGHVGDYGVSFALDPSSTAASGPWDYSSGSNTKVEVGTDASVPGWEWLGHASAGLSVTFASQDSLYFSAGETTVEQVANIDKLQTDLISTALEQGMPIGQSVVIERQLTSHAMVIVSSEKSGELKAIVRGDVEIGQPGPGAVASLAGHLDVKRQVGGTSKQEFPNGMVLAYRVVTLSTRGWWFWRHLTIRAFGETDQKHLDAALEPDDYFVRF